MQSVNVEAFLLCRSHNEGWPSGLKVFLEEKPSLKDNGDWNCMMLNNNGNVASSSQEGTIQQVMDEGGRFESNIQNSPVYHHVKPGVK